MAVSAEQVRAAAAQQTAGGTVMGTLADKKKRPSAVKRRADEDVPKTKKQARAQAEAAIAAGWTHEELATQYENLPPELKKTFLKALPPDLAPQVVRMHTARAATGTYTGADRDQRADMLRGENINDAQDLMDSVSTNLDDYTINPTLERDVGWRPQDRYEYLGNEDVDLDAALQERAIDQSRTETGGRDAQMRALSAIEDTVNQGGLSAIDRARLMRTGRMRDVQARGQREAILSNMEEQGRGGSNAEMIALLGGAQQNQNMKAMDDAQTAALGLERTDRLRSQAAGIGADVQTADDAIDRFNTAGRREMEAQNLDRMNKARELEFGERNLRKRENQAYRNKGVDKGFDYEQGLEERNVGTLNEAEAANKSAGYGTRGMVRDKAGVMGFLQGARDSAANSLSTLQAEKRQSEHAAEQAWISAGSSLLSAGLPLAFGGKGKK